MSTVPPELELKRIRNERDLYLRLLNLGTQDELEPFLENALELVVEITGAERGYLEIREEHAEEAWAIAHGCSNDQVDDIRGHISHGIVGEAIATGRTIVTHSALLDERFRENVSVQNARIEAVLCAPIGGDAARGVVYLQGRVGAGPFSEEHQEQAERLAQHLAPLADRVLLRHQAAQRGDATATLRERYALDGIVGRSRALAKALEQALLAAPLDVNVLLTGESGTGKSQLARAIHENSARHSGPFVELNCAAIPETLIESELFGARKGSHSEAKQDIEGKVSAAEGGTLFLDEIAELPYDAQSSLLQLLQSREYYALGATAPTRADIRLVAATNADLEEAVAEKRFREDLYFRLCVLPVSLPNLSDRREDLPDLATALAERVGDRHGLGARPLTHGALRAIEAAPWPGNVRQLENVLEAAAIRAAGDGADHISTRHLFPDREDSASEDGPLPFQAATRAFQREFVAKALEETGWNVTETARRLELTRSHVYNLIKALGIER